MGEIKDGRWIVTSIEELAEALQFIEERSLRNKAKLPLFPRTLISQDRYEYDVLLVQAWFLKNRKAFTRELYKDLAHPAYQTIVELQPGQEMSKEYEQTRLLKHQANRAAIKEELERGRVCESLKRDADEIERMSILKNLLYTNARNEVPTLLSKTTPQEMEEATKSLVDSVLSQAQEAWRKRSDEAKDESELDPELVVNPPESELEDQEQLEFPEQPPAIDTPTQPTG